MSQTLASEKIDEIIQHFADFDTDNNGFIDLEEFSQLIRILAPEADDEEIARGFKTIDSNNDHEIDCDEFVQWWKTNWFVF